MAITTAWRTVWVLSWQTSVLVGIIWVCSYMLRKVSPIFHYWLWVIVLVRLVIPVVQVNVPLPVGISGQFRNSAEIRMAELARNMKITDALSVVDRWVEGSRARGKGTPAESSAGAVGNFATAHTDRASATADQVSGNAAINPLSVTEFTVVPSADKPSQEKWFTAIILIWLGIVIALLLTALARAWKAMLLVREFPVVKREDLLDFLETKCREMKIRRVPEIRVMDRNLPVGPTVTGIFSPKILLPFQIVDSWNVRDIEPVIVHELIHIKRHDLHINSLQIIVQIIYFFNPFVWLANWKLREYREQVCDDVTIQEIDFKRKAYSRSIINVLEGIMNEPLWGLEPAFSERRSSLSRRIMRITNKHYQFYKPLNFVSVVALVAVGIFSFSLSCDTSNSPRQIMGEEVELALAAAKRVRPELPPELADRIIIEITGNGRFEVEGVQANLASLETALRDAKESTGKSDVVIITYTKDLGIKIEELIKVFEKAGIMRFAFNHREE